MAWSGGTRLVGIGRHASRVVRAIVAARGLPGLLREAPELVRKGVTAVLTGGPIALADPDDLPPQAAPYDVWLSANQWHETDIAALRQRLGARRARLPKLSVVMPVFDPKPEHLDRAIQSVVDQLFDDWELCIADDASRDRRIRACLEGWARRESRIRVVYRSVNGGISRGTNDAAALASGDFLAFLDHDDQLSPDALGEVALHLAEHPAVDLLYSDDDKISEAGARYHPQFKPDWSPELLLSYMYLSHLVVIRRQLFDDLEGLRPAYDGAQDHDLALRASEAARSVAHLPHVLYHWRATAHSAARTGTVKPHSFDAGRRAVQAALDRRGVRATTRQPDWAVDGALGIYAHDFPDDGPTVTIVIPTRNNAADLSLCLRSLESTTYRHYDVLVLDNGSDDPATLDYLSHLPHRVERVLCRDGDFSFSDVINQGAALAQAEYLLLLNDDTEVLAPAWLSSMVGYAGLAGVGAVGARLIYPNGRIQHAGVVRGYHQGMVGHAFKHTPAAEHGYLWYASVARNYGAVTAACMLTPRQLFVDLGGFDERRLAIAYNDVDYCYRLRARGHRVVYSPQAELRHHEGRSRGLRDHPPEPAHFRRHYPDTRDPYYSPHLSLEDESCQIQPRRLLRGQSAPCQVVAVAAAGGMVDRQIDDLLARLRDRGTAVERLRTRDAALPGVTDLADPTRYGRRVEGLADALAASGARVLLAISRDAFPAVDAAARAGLPVIWIVSESAAWQAWTTGFHVMVAARARRCFLHPYRVAFDSYGTKRTYASLNRRHTFTVIHGGIDADRVRRLAGRDIPGPAPRRDGDAIVALARGETSDALAAYRRLAPDIAARLRVVVDPHPNAIVAATPDILVWSSTHGSFSRDILEAMALDVTIVATPSHGIAEQVQDEVNALCYEVADRAGLARALTRLVQDADLRARLARNGRSVLERLNTLDDTADALATLLREAAATRP